MAVYTWNAVPPTGFVYSYDDTEPTIKDQIRGLVGDVDGLPVAYMSDNAINAVATTNNDDLYRSAAMCAERCAARCLQVYREVKQGHRLEIKNFDPEKAFEAFMKLADMLRDKSIPEGLPSPGVLSGKVCSPRHDGPYGHRPRTLYWDGTTDY